MVIVRSTTHKVCTTLIGGSLDVHKESGEGMAAGIPAFEPAICM
jgi:hypothetical protein